MNAISPPEVTIAPYADDPHRRYVIWRCRQCHQGHSWVWMVGDIPFNAFISMDCDHCDHCQLVRFPSTLERTAIDSDLEQQLAAQIAWRDTDPTEALLDPPRKPYIQDGQRLARVAATIAEHLMDRNWVQLRMDSSKNATDLIEMAAALREFGA